MSKRSAELVCKFVYVEGESELFGESIDLHRGMLIVKAGSKFYAVPENSIKRVEKDSVYIEKFDKKKAEKEGKKWIEEKSKPVSLEELKKYGFGED